MTPEMDTAMSPDRDDERITRALEQGPGMQVPADFTARLMERLPEQKVQRVRVQRGFFATRTHYGRNAMLVGALVLCCLLVAAGVPSNRDVGWRVAEWTALAQLGGIALWCGLTWRAWRSV